MKALQFSQAHGIFSLQNKFSNYLQGSKKKCTIAFFVDDGTHLVWFKQGGGYPPVQVWAGEEGYRTRWEEVRGYP